MKKLSMVLGVVFLLSACAGNAPKPVAGNSAAVAVTVSLRPPLVSFLKQTPDVVYFVKLDANTAVTGGMNIIPSNYNDGNDFYLLNAEPGRYVAVGAMYSKQGQTSSSNMGAGSGMFTLSISSNNQFATFFDESSLGVMEATVATGEMAYMGEFIVAMQNGMDEATAGQKYYAKLVDGKSDMNHYRGKLDEAKHSMLDKKNFLEKVKKEMHEAGWDVQAVRGLAKLK